MGEHDTDGIAERLAAFLEGVLGRDGLEVRGPGPALRRRVPRDLGLRPARRARRFDRAADPAARSGPGSGAARRAWRPRPACCDGRGGAGVPVAPVVAASDDGAIAGAPFLVMGRVEGETIARRLLRDDEFAVARSRLVGQCGAALAAIHAVPRLGDRPPRGAGADQPAPRACIDMLGEPHPAFELGLPMARASTARRRSSPTLVHGDFRLGNLIVDQDGLRRGARLGAGPPRRPDGGPRLALRAGLAVRLATCRSAASASYEELLAAYESASGSTGRPRGAALVGGARHAQVGRHLHHAGRAHLTGRQPLGRAGRDRPPRLRERVRPARPDRCPTRAGCSDVGDRRRRDPTSGSARRADRVAAASRRCASSSRAT